MTNIWQHKAKQLWLGYGETVSKDLEENEMSSWMMAMGDAWKELGIEQPDYQRRKRWREAVINCCSKVNQSSEETNSPEDRSKLVIKTEAQSTDDRFGVESGKPDDTKKMKIWSETLRQCWKEAAKEKPKKKERRTKNQESATDYKKQWRQMMGKMMRDDCPTSRQEMKKKKQMIKEWWQKQHEKNKKKTRKIDSNESCRPTSEVRTEYKPIIVPGDNDINMKGRRYYNRKYSLNITLLRSMYDLNTSQSLILIDLHKKILNTL